MKLSTIIKAICVGGTMMVPGVSGGSMAMLLGIYDKLISAVSNFTKDIKGNLKFLGTFCVGGLLGILLFSKPILFMLEQYPMVTLYFFMGAIAGGIPMIYKQAGVKKLSVKTAIYPIIGIIGVVLLELIMAPMAAAGALGGNSSFIILLLAGIGAAVALVLPEISVSYVLLIFGLYDRAIRALHSLSFSFLIPFGGGVLLGVILTTKGLEQLMERYPQPVYLVIGGFILGSIGEVFPGLPTSAGEGVLCVIMAVLGAAAIIFLSSYSSQKE